MTGHEKRELIVCVLFVCSMALMFGAHVLQDWRIRKSQKDGGS